MFEILVSKRQIRKTLWPVIRDPFRFFFFSSLALKTVTDKQLKKSHDNCTKETSMVAIFKLFVCRFFDAFEQKLHCPLFNRDEKKETEKEALTQNG